MEQITTILDRLASLAHAEGGWGYAADQPAHIEPTCLCVLALSLGDVCYQPALQTGLGFLKRCRRADGSYRLDRGRAEAVWGTATALYTMATLDGPTPDSKATAAFLLGVNGCVIKDDPEIADMCDIDYSLIGWPWAVENFSWVEPTAWACLALNRMGQRQHPRVKEGLKLLQDRAFDSGGVNYGNRMILGKMTEPIPGPTALWLLAVQGEKSHPRTRAAVDFLRRQLESSADLEHLGWGRLALDLHLQSADERRFLDRIDDRVRAVFESQPEPWAKLSPPRLALAALALGTTRRNMFALSEHAPDAPEIVETQSSCRPPFIERVRSGFRGFLIRGLDRFRQPPSKSEVHIAAVSEYNADLVDVLTRQYALFRALVPLSGKRVVLKPNLVEYHRDKVINTDPRVVAAVIELCRKEGAAEVIVAEGPGHWRNVEYLVSASGLGDVLRHYSVPFVDLNHDEPVKMLNLGRLTKLDYLYLAKTIVSADVVISLPKLKTHHWAGATLSLKNLFGTLPGICYGWPKNELHWRGIPNSIIDIALTHTPQLAIVDGIIGMEGDGPLNGTAKPLGVIVMGADLVAVDATCCRLMQLPTDRIVHLVLGQHKRLGRLAEGDINQLGEPIAGLARPFAPPPRVEKILLPKPA